MEIKKNMVELEYANAYTEVLEILKYISQEDYNKIPNEKIELFKTNCNKNYTFHYDITKTLNEQNVSKKAKVIIAILFRDYWATDIQRRKIKAKEEYDKQIKEKETKEKHNENSLLAKELNENKDDTKNHTEIMIYKESLIKKIINRILKWFKLK